MAMHTLLEIIKRTTDYFAKHSVESARLNAELIVAHALGLNRMQIYLQFERPLTDAELETIRPLVRRRGQREPLSYVLGEAVFLDLKLKVDRRVLVPRPETEQLVELVRDTLTTPPRSLLDLGTGSGALALALAKHYSDARAVTGARFDLIVANPPYLTEAEWTEAEPEVNAHEPRDALVAGDEGCSDLLQIIAGAPGHLEPGGWLFLETGIAQHPRLLDAMKRAGLSDARSIKDWSERDRFVAARKAQM
jgi:release factor glutamine methyltransferase